jgi:ABC-type molybdate transport system substrate-binding protein
MRTVAIAVAGGISLVACVSAGCAQTAEIRMLACNAVKTSLEVLAPEFEKAAEYKPVITFGVASRFLTTPAVAAVLKAKGLEPG